MIFTNFGELAVFMRRSVALLLLFAQIIARSKRKPMRRTLAPKTRLASART